jgi:hypothetical protein
MMRVFFMLKRWPFCPAACSSSSSSSGGSSKISG